MAESRAEAPGKFLGAGFPFLSSLKVIMLWILQSDLYAEKDEIHMLVLQSNTDALLVAIPMVGLLFAGFFRLDEIFGKPKKPVENRRQMSGWDKNGRPICTDPDGKNPEIRRKHE